MNENKINYNTILLIVIIILLIAGMYLYFGKNRTDKDTIFKVEVTKDAPAIHINK